MSNNFSRRDLLSGSAAAAMGLALGTSSNAAGASSFLNNIADPTESFDPKRRLRLGIIGCGGKGSSGMAEAARFGDVVAICDVDLKNRAQGMNEHPKATSFDDYRKMYDMMRGKLDAVVISTPDHHHSIAAAMAMKQGLHTYCEKPLTRTIWEARQLGKLAREKRIGTQMGNQSTANSSLRKMAEILKRGTFGAVKEIHLWTDRAKAYWRQGIPRPASAVTPKTVDFDLWIGPATARPYGDGYHPFSWRGFWDFGTGALGDMGCHIFNMPYMALDLRDPISVKAETSGHNRDSFPEWSIVHYEFPERNGRKAVNLHWYDGGKRPSQDLAPGFTFGGNGSIIICENATIYCPNEQNTEYLIVGGGKMPDVEFEVSPGHMAEFAIAAQGGKQARSNIATYASGLTETVLLGNLAIWADGPKLEWDARKMQVKGTNEFDSLIKPTYREGWSL